VVAEEIEAEIIRSRLEAEGIRARIAPRTRIGYPAAWSPAGLGFGIGSFEVRVPSEYAKIARGIVADVEPKQPPRSRARLVVRVIATALLLYFLIGMAYGLTQFLPERF
jgi:hypothetical protein